MKIKIALYQNDLLLGTGEMNISNKKQIIQILQEDKNYNNNPINNKDISITLHCYFNQNYETIPIKKKNNKKI